MARGSLRKALLKIRNNVPWPGFSATRMCNFSAGILFSQRILSRFFFPAGFSTESRRRFFLLGGIPASTDFSARRKFPAGKMGHLYGFSEPALAIIVKLQLQVGNSNANESTTNLTWNNGEFNF